MNTHKLIPLLFISFIFCQFNNVTVDIEYNENDSNYHIKKNIIDGFNKQIEEYFLLNNFCQEFNFIQASFQSDIIIFDSFDGIFTVKPSKSSETVI